MEKKCKHCPMMIRKETKILFFQNVNDTGTATVSGSNETMQGSPYFPGALLNYSGSNAAAYTIIVAKDITFSGSNSYADDNYSSLPGGESPIRTNAVSAE